MGLDLETLNHSVTKLRADIPEDAFTAGILGSQRIGNGVLNGREFDRNFRSRQRRE